MIGKMQLIVVIQILVFSTISCVAQRVTIQLVNCTLAEEEIERIKGSLTFQDLYYGEIFKVEKSVGLRAKIFSNEAEFQKYSKAKHNFNPIRDHSVAYYNHDIKEMILHKDVGNLSQVFSHELSHAMFDFHCPEVDMDPWLTEGLAEVFEDVVYQNEEFVMDKSFLNKVPTAKRYFLEGQSLLAVSDDDEFYKNATQDANYSLAWALTYYLFTQHPEVLKQIIRTAGTGNFYPLDSHYPGGLPALEADAKSFFFNYNPTSN